MRFHVVSLPHTQVTRQFESCAYTAKVRKFCMMLTMLGHEVLLYAGEQNEAPVTELIPCISEAQRQAAVGRHHFTQASFDWTLPHWRTFNANAIAGIKARAQPRDFVCIIAGIAQKAIADALPDLMTVEFGIGYGGNFARYRVFESYAWMHTCYGAQANNRDPHSIDPPWFDCVIPNAVDPNDLPFQPIKQDYYLFMGRLIERKGFHIAVDVCRELGMRLVIAGQGTPPPGVEYRGVVGPSERATLMGGAIALFAPTTYVEPFGGVVVEAMMCGTPVLTTDWGAFVETNLHGVTGFRCRNRREFIAAAQICAKGRLDHQEIRGRAVSKYSLGAVAVQYQDYFDRLMTLWGDGWNAA
jgi:glycosyltransferase involved in cell wall biosynthesis